MKKSVLLILLAVFLISLVSCTGDTDVSFTEEDYNGLTEKVAELEKQLAEKGDEITSLKAQLENAGNETTNVTEEVETIEFSIDNTFRYYTMTAGEIKQAFGEDYEKITKGCEGVKLGLKYNDLGVTFAFENFHEDDFDHRTIERVYLNDGTEYKGVKLGQTEEEIKNALGEPKGEYKLSCEGTEQGKILFYSVYGEALIVEISNGNGTAQDIYFTINPSFLLFLD